MDYRKFLGGGGTTEVLPYFGGSRVDTHDRRFHVRAPLAPGWWQFAIDGRRAVPMEPAPPAELSSRPVMRGHWACGWIVASGTGLDRIALPPDDEPEPLSRVTARRWYSGDLVFDAVEFEDEAELAARRALDERRALGDLRDVVPSLRAAFGYALGIAIAREMKLDIAMRELTPRVVAIADGGPEVVRGMFAELLAQRRREAEETERRLHEAEQRRRLETAAGTARVKSRARDPRVRADDVLDNAGARMLSCRSIDRGARLDVTWELDGTRIISLVEADTLQVLDPGICLAGAHRVLTLDAMPSVVREAIEQEHLNITRRG